ncbi:MAG: sulfatase-like hydrolase/transferase, partial [Planctomycetota bacterium]
MSASPPQPVRPLAALAAGAASLLVASALARITEIGGITLGLLSPRLGHAVVAAGASGALGILFGRRAMPAGRALLGAALFLSAVQTLGLEATRRRQTLMAAGVGAVTMAVGLTLRAETRRASSKRWIPCAHGAITVGSALGVAWLVDLDGRPYRIELPPIPSKEAPPTAPDIVLITMDTTVHGAVTPSAAFPFQGALNAFRDEAVEFRRVSAEASHTHPSMASLATSRWPLEHGSISTSPGMDPRLPTLAEHVRAHGYRTAGFVENPWLGPGFGLDRGFEFLARRARLDDIEEWLGADDARPAFLHVHLFEPHGPYELRPWALELLGRPVDSKARARLGDTIDARFIRDGEVPGAHSLTSADFEWLRTIYFTEVVAMDRWIGSFLELLESRDPGSQHTIIAITSDHGEEFGE